MISPCLGFMALVLFCKFIYNIVIYRVSKGTYNLQNILIFGYVLDENSVKLIFLYFCFRSIDSLPILSFLLKKKPGPDPITCFPNAYKLKMSWWSLYSFYPSGLESTTSWLVFQTNFSNRISLLYDQI